MANGTIAVTNGSNILTGTGTTFTTEVVIGDLITFKIQEVVYTVTVVSIVSNTKITMIRNFDGPTTAELPWRPFPAQMIMEISAQLNVDVQYLMRGFILDKQNWQQLLTVDADVTVKLPDGSSYTGLSWVKLSRIFKDLDMVTITAITDQIDKDAKQVSADKTTIAGYKTEAASSATQASGSASAASTSASQASGYKTAAAGSANSAAISATLAGTKATAAEQSAAAAAASASSVNADVINAAIAGKINRSGDTMTGLLILSGDATDPKGAVTKQQLDAKPAGGLPLLHSYQTDTRDHIEAGEAPQDGQLLSRALFPDAWAAIQAKRTVITDAAWLADPLKRGNFSSGDGSTTFRIPDKNGKSSGSIGAVVGRGDGLNSARAIGTIQMDAIRNITGSLPNSQVLNGNIATGAFSNNTNTSTPYPAYSATEAGQGKITFNASLAPGVLTANENRMLNVTTCWVIKLAGSAFNEGQVNALELATQITLLTTRVTTLEANQKFVILYPEGTEAAPSTLGVNQRKTIANPFPGRRIAVVLEVLYMGNWGATTWLYNSSTALSSGALAHAVGPTASDSNIIVQTGSQTLYTVSSADGNPFGIVTGSSPTAPFRIRVSTED